MARRWRHFGQLQGQGRYFSPVSTAAVSIRSLCVEVYFKSRQWHFEAEYRRRAVAVNMADIVDVACVWTRIRKRTTSQQKCWRLWTTRKSKFPAEVRQKPNASIIRLVDAAAASFILGQAWRTFTFYNSICAQRCSWIWPTYGRICIIKLDWIIEFSRGCLGFSWLHSQFHLERLFTFQSKILWYQLKKNKTADTK